MRRAQLLTDDEMAAWRPNLLSWTLIMRDLDRQLRQDSGMPHAYFAVLLALSEANGSRAISLTDLAEQLDYSQSRMSHAISKMIASGWIESTAGDDRRIRNLSITSEGRRVYLGALAGHLDQIRASFLSHLTDRDLDDLRRIGSTLLTGLTRDEARQSSDYA